MGADNLVQLPRWRRWRRLAKRTPMAVLPRPGWTRRATHGAAASTLRRHRVGPRRILVGPGTAHARWCLVPAREHPASATAIRAARAVATASPLATAAPHDHSLVESLALARR
jgi:nicotinate-nucleotide adenylyltransferase